MHTWFKTAEDLPTVRLVLLYFCALLVMQGPLGNFTLTYSLGWGLLLNQVGIMLLPAGLLCRWLKLDAGTLFPTYAIPRREWSWVVLTTICVVMLSDYTLSLTESLLPIPSHIQETLDQLLAVHGTGEFFKKLFLFCLLPSVAEEVYFRGFCQTSLSHRVGVLPAILLTALLFALAHGNMWYMHLYFGLGCFLGWIYEKSGSLWPAIVAHFINNTWTFITHMLGINTTGGNIIISLLLTAFSIAGLVWGIRRWGRQLETVAR
jgi:membrane protease YdiL (CAAX protease family)